MPKQTSSKKRRKNRVRPKLTAFTILLCLTAAVILWMFFSAVFVRIRFITIVDTDIPAEFDNYRLLYVTDPDCRGLLGSESALNMLHEMEAFECDALLLGGDYSCPTFIQTLDRGRDGAAREAYANALEFISGLRDLSYPGGIYAVTGDNDAGNTLLAEYMALSRVTLLKNDVAVIRKGNSSITIAGFGADGDNPLSSEILSEKVKRNDFVICLTHMPTSIRSVMTNLSDGKTDWCDLLLTGHTHGGQISLFGHSLIGVSDRDNDYTPGVRYSGSIPVVYSSGLGCEWISLRLGSTPEVYVITLKAG